LETERVIDVEETGRFLQDEMLDAQTDSAIGHFIISNICSGDKGGNKLYVERQPRPTGVCLLEAVNADRDINPKGC
jgi:hypothetical protein